MVDSSNLSKWMEDSFENIKDLTIKDLILPGTHNSITYNLK